MNTSDLTVLSASSEHLDVGYHFSYAWVSDVAPHYEPFASVRWVGPSNDRVELQRVDEDPPYVARGKLLDVAWRTSVAKERAPHGGLAEESAWLITLAGYWAQRPSTLTVVENTSARTCP